jgi:hypothetical protein
MWRCFGRRLGWRDVLTMKIWVFLYSTEREMKKLQPPAVWSRPASGALSRSVSGENEATPHNWRSIPKRRVVTGAGSGRFVWTGLWSRLVIRTGTKGYPLVPVCSTSRD